MGLVGYNAGMVRESPAGSQTKGFTLQKVKDDGEKEKDDGRIKSVKVNKEEDNKMRTTAANVAARAAVGGGDMFSKWQLMAEQARQKREGGTDMASGSQAGKDTNRKPLNIWTEYKG
ncbi:hypothetical protein KPL70_017020 [Citrus sinensis]|nr:hypothetical protein KPL70_017020 [Citrus sinensis]